MLVEQSTLWIRYWEARNSAVYDYTGETQLLRNELEKSRAKTVLSLGCGSAPYLRRLAKLGYSCTGVDIDERVIEIGRGLARGERCDIELVHQDIRNLSVAGNFDAVIAMHLTFPTQDWERILHAVGNHLNPGGLFLAGFVYTRGIKLPGDRGLSCDSLELVSGESLIEVDSYLVRRDHYECSIYLIEDGNTSANCEKHSTRIYYLSGKSEIERLLATEHFVEMEILQEEGIGFGDLTAVLIRAHRSPEKRGQNEQSRTQ